MAEEKKKLCPLAYAVGKGAYDQEVASFDSCKEKECAWWVPSEECCSIRLIAVDLDRIANHSTFG